jgi:hypothetical protein
MATSCGTDADGDPGMIARVAEYAQEEFDALEGGRVN